MFVGYANTVLFYVKDLGNHRFGYPWGSWHKSTVKIERQLCINKSKMVNIGIIIEISEEQVFGMAVRCHLKYLYLILEFLVSSYVSTPNSSFLLMHTPRSRCGLRCLDLCQLHWSLGLSSWFQTITLRSFCEVNHPFKFYLAVSACPKTEADMKIPRAGTV